LSVYALGERLKMRAHKLNVTVPQDHQLKIEVRLPDDFPSGSAEVIVLSGSTQGRSGGEARQDMLAVVDELRTQERMEEEERLLDDFGEFRKSHPVDLMSLFGIFKPRVKGVTLTNIEEAIREGAAEG
jgi:hypothetical protein